MPGPTYNIYVTNKYIDVFTKIYLDRKKEAEMAGFFHSDDNISPADQEIRQRHRSFERGKKLFGMMVTRSSFCSQWTASTSHQ
jgi:hypothetical protein